MEFPDLSHYHPLTSIGTHCIYKCTEGLDIIDPSYANAKTLCIGNGFRFGAYHFGRGGSGTDQADYFLKFAQPDDKMIVALDWEETMGVAGAEQFAQRIHDVLGRWPVVYTRKTYAEPLIGTKQTILSNCPLWVASYQSSPSWPKQWQTYAIQQYSNGVDGPTPHGVTGIGAALDMNRLNPRFGDIATWWGTDIATPTINPTVADRFIAPIGPDGLQSNGLWLRQLFAPAGQWYDANPFENNYNLNGVMALHTGADLNLPNDADKGQPIRAVANGVILFADRIIGSSWGNLIIQESILPDGSKVWFRYAHSDPMQVKAGDIVTIGQHLSDVSNAFGLMPYHLHFDVSLSGVLAQGYDGAVDWPGERRTYLEANYTDPYKWLLSHMESVPVTNIVTATVLASARVDVTGEAAILSTVLDTLTPGTPVQIDTDSKVTTQAGQTFYKVSSGTDTGGFIAADCLQLPGASVPVVRYVNTDAGSNLVTRSTGSHPADNSNLLPTKLARGTKIAVLEPANSAGYVQLISINDVAVSGAAWVADSLLSVTAPK